MSVERGRKRTRTRAVKRKKKPRADFRRMKGGSNIGKPWVARAPSALRRQGGRTAVEA